MASGDKVIDILEISSPGDGTEHATKSTRQSASTVEENFDVWLFVDAAIKYLDLKCVINGYGNGGVTLEIWWMADTATTNEVRWEAAFRRLQIDSEDLDAAHTYDFNTVDDTAPGTAGQLSKATITFTNGADMDSVADGETFWLRLRRNGTHANDDMTDTAQLFAIQGLET